MQFLRALFFARSVSRKERLLDWFQQSTSERLDTADVTLVFLDREVASPDLPLEDTVWTLNTKIDGAAAMTAAGVTGSLVFNSDGTLDVEGPCNSGSTSYETSGNEITVGGLGLTEIACEVDMGADYEQHLTNLFAQGTLTYAISEDRLTVMRGDDGVIAKAD